MSPASPTRAGRAWAGLNERQRVYLRVIYDRDRAAEADLRRDRAQRRTPPPA
ncbi:hypothetical protein [Actinopolymorpha pittospori]|uniref:Uncharacterized protein n=1 Tax=Actinopolymorpha pittospori TaxID=648752 RepID=A0A927MYM0_9ACTN|nr:hypothetical protein [Actinopolymorpha pittospori]MBE1608602.1 hypothetical protein [Actinopolymorpha pittospori]